MAFEINSLTLCNFMSIGNVTQAISFNNEQLTLVLGENLDLGGADSGARNGVGKTSILNGLSFALFGMALTKIKLNNLINKTNSKNMVVTAEFERNGKIYHIERGRSPNFLRFWCGDDADHVDNDAQGDSRETQKAIEDAFGMSHDMFKHIVALNTYTEPFLALPSGSQRIIIEQLLGITLLSDKADALKDLIKESKGVIKDQETMIAADIDANKRIQEQIDSAKRRQRQWEKSRDATLEELAIALGSLDEINIDVEIKNHTLLKDYTDNETTRASINKDIKSNNTSMKRRQTKIVRLADEIETLGNKKCHTCDQAFHGDQYEKTLLDKEAELLENAGLLDTESTLLISLTANLDDTIWVDAVPTVFYKKIEDAYNHKNSLVTLEDQIASKQDEEDPYADQILEMEQEAIKEINYTILNDLTVQHEHQEFLYKLLTKKDSFVRKRIIEQNLAHLNSRLSYYLDEMGLPHAVKFLNDLSVEITELGRDLDFDNLSRGERNRLILSLSWAFRDVWEALYQPINLLFIDELVDSGLDAKGVDAALGVLKKMSRDRGKSVWLVSHRDELISRVGSILRVSKENGYTNFSQDD